MSIISSLAREAPRVLRADARLVVQPASAHCDTEDGPVVKAGRRALISGDVNHALAWVHAGDEDEVVPGGGELACEGFADAARGAGDECGGHEVAPVMRLLQWSGSR